MKFLTTLRLAAQVGRHAVTGVRRPWAVAWLITGRCTRNCLYCQWSELPADFGIDTLQARRVIDQMARSGVVLLSFSGGEPLIRDDMGELLEYAGASGLACKLNSNGDLVPERTGWLRRLDLLQISLDGPKGINDVFRGKGNAAAVERALESAFSAGIPVKLVGCITSANALRMTEVLQYVSGLGACISFQPLVTHGLSAQARTMVVPDDEMLGAALNTLLDIKKSGGRLGRALGTSVREIEHYLQRLREPYSVCPCPVVTATLMPDGGLTFCGIPDVLDNFPVVDLGFEKAFSMLTPPRCDGRACCVGKMKIMRASGV